jgi:hypothetical protein
LRSCRLCSHSRTSYHFTEPDGSSQCSQEPSTCPYPETDRSHPTSSLLLIYKIVYFLQRAVQRIQASYWRGPFYLIVSRYNIPFTYLNFSLLHQSFTFTLNKLLSTLFIRLSSPSLLYRTKFPLSLNRNQYYN